MNAQSARIALRRLKVNPDDLVVVSFPGGTTATHMQKMMHTLTPIGVYYGVNLIGVYTGTNIRSIDEKTMNNLGWYRR